MNEGIIIADQNNRIEVSRAGSVVWIECGMGQDIESIGFDHDTPQEMTALRHLIAALTRFSEEAESEAEGAD